MKKLVVACFAFAVVLAFAITAIGGAPPKLIKGFNIEGIGAVDWDHMKHAKPPKKCPDCHKGAMKKETLPANLKSSDHKGCYETKGCHGMADLKKHLGK